MNKYLEKLHSVPLNWSSVNSFRYNKDNWFENFILGKKATSPQMTFGSYVDKRLQTDPDFLPSMPRYEMMQHKMTIQFGDLKLMGTPDGINIKTKPKVLADFKTGVNKWDQKRTEEHGQLLMYLLLIYVTMKIKPEEFECRIHWMPTEKTESGDFETTIKLIEPANENIQTFICRHTMAEILKFGAYLKETYKEMEEYVINK